MYRRGKVYVKLERLEDAILDFSTVVQGDTMGEEENQAVAGLF